MASKKSRSEPEETTMAPSDIPEAPDYPGLCERTKKVLTLLLESRDIGSVASWETRRYMANYPDPYCVRDLLRDLKAALPE